MSEGVCVECGESTVYEEELGSAVCANCGTLTNPSQNVLASHLEHVDTSGYERTSFVNTVQGSTLKGRHGWALAGQEKDARDRRNMVAMHEAIRSIAGSLSSTSSATRAQAIFDQAMRKGRYRWGRKAKLIAGASLAIALREANKSDSLRDIAYLLEEPLPSLSKVFTATTLLLQLRLISADPAQHLSVLQAHLLTLIRQPASLPHQLSTALTPLEGRISTVQHTAIALASLVSRVPSLAALPTASTACAVLILSLEGELSASLPQAGALAQAFGARVGASKAIVMQRYKAIYDLVEEYVRDVPWLDAHEKSGRGRSKVAKRVVVARGLKDVVQFQGDIWHRKLEAQAKPGFDIEVDSSADGDDEDSLSASEQPEGALEISKPSGTPDDNAICGSSRRKKTRRTPHERAVEQASQFLLNPLAKTASALTAKSSGRRSETGELLEHFLTADDSALTHAFVHPPTRLQLLAASRGEEAVLDEELFDEGELEGLLRSQEEVEVLRQTFEWDPADGGDAETTDTPRKPKKRKREDTGYQSDNAQDSGGKRTKRVDMDALARLLDPETNLNDIDDDEDFDALGLGIGLGEKSDDVEELSSYTIEGGEDEEVGEWRPLSPGGATFDEDRYEV
ncbi:uncharacterized protein PHACADRAFT_144858 [Phanerochaete carnosa HHB-10118-sp]|uniref:B-related factor 1 n=1 Tax=Phanerochaete carnosa (strain HHB-10118-sp) TaxID=650164 RepID=K5V0E1_PHACS|nr:uncharacterized protein PHACADRAFT_144858 [Phanerochaete carnosa HHB-10118-sp]EKM55926.1 hypothetical protein PHACADRAFT_144858 [Phanerochaete carnosa HHB-10118-sp]